MSKINPNHSQTFLRSLVSALATSIPLWLGAMMLFPAAGLAQKSASLLLSQTNAIQATSAQKETLYLNNDRVYSYTLIASERGKIDGIVVPTGATIVGRYEPAKGGLRYVARAVVYDKYTYRISAASRVLEDVKDPRDTSAGAIAADAAIGAAAGIVLGEIFGDADAVEVIGGAAAGVAVGNITADRVVVIEPERSIVLYDN